MFKSSLALTEIEKGMRDLILAGRELQKQVSCGCEGHEFGVCDVDYDGTYEAKRYSFKCIKCDVKYWRSVGDLTELESGIVGLARGDVHHV